MSLDVFRKWVSEPLVSFGSFSISVHNLFFALVTISVAYWLTRLVRLVFQRVAEETDESNRYSLYIIQRFVHYVIVVIGIVVALSALGVDMSKLALIATALSVGIGMGLQSIINNFFSGFIILFEKSLKTGDYIELEQGLGGTVVEIRVRSTLIRTNDNLDVVVPNSEFVTGRVINWTHVGSLRRLRVPFSTTYDSEVDQVKKVVMEAASAVITTLHRDDCPMDVWLERFGDNGLEFILAVWVDPRLNPRPGALTGNYLEAIDRAFRQQGIRMPFPQREIHIRRDLSGN